MLSAKFTRFLLLSSTLTRKEKEQVSYIYDVSDLCSKVLDSNVMTDTSVYFTGFFQMNAQNPETADSRGGIKTKPSEIDGVFLTEVY